MSRYLVIALLCAACGPAPETLQPDVPTRNAPMCGELPCTGDPCGPKGPWGDGADPKLCRESMADAGTVTAS